MSDSSPDKHCERCGHEGDGHYSDCPTVTTKGAPCACYPQGNDGDCPAPGCAPRSSIEPSKAAVEYAAAQAPAHRIILQGAGDIAENNITAYSLSQVLAAFLEGAKLTARSATGLKWTKTIEEQPSGEVDVIGWWKTEAGVAHHTAGHRWHNPEDDEDVYHEPDYWMPLPNVPTDGGDKTT